jgi:hypothetical protein
MHAEITRFVRLAAIAALAVACSTAARAQACPASPSYSPDFTSNQNCLALNPLSTLPVFVGTSPNTVMQLTTSLSNQTGSAWYSTPQNVENGFSTTFQFQFMTPSIPPADGIAFVIQNSSTAAIGFTGGNGGALGYGDDDANSNPSLGQGIPNSLAIEFDTYQNSWDPPSNGNGSDSHVAVQSCGTGPNTSHHEYLCGGNAGSNSTLGAPVVTSTNMADGAIHTVTITYVPACATCSPAISANIQVILDGVEQYPSGVPVDLSSIGLGPGQTAYVGFTGATGGDWETQDILNWTFTPQGQSQSGTVTPTQTTTVFGFNGGFLDGNPNSGFDFTVLETTSSLTLQMVVTAIPQTSQQACNAIVQQSFPNAQCFVYANGGGQGVDVPVMIEVTCPQNGSCGSGANPFNATLGSDFSFTCTENPPLACGPPPAPFTFGFPNLTSLTGLPGIGFLKGEGDPNNPCTPSTAPNAPPLFQSNQIISFTLGDTESKPIKGGSGGSASCWVATYNTPGELPTVSIVAPVNNANYQQGATAYANYTCNAVNNGSAATGPYLTVESCSATDTPGGSVASGAPFDTTTPGPHTFVASVEDSATNTNSSTVTYNVQGTQTITFPTIPAQTYGVAPFALSATAPGGTVTYSVISGPATVLGNVLTITGVGSVTVQASQAGNSYYAPATPVSQTFTVNTASTTTTVTSSANPSLYEQPVSFTATVAPQYGGTPTGTVTFKNGKTSLGSAAVSGGVAVLTTSALAIGTHCITASYSGDANFTGGVSATLSQVVSKAFVTITGSPQEPLTTNSSGDFVALVTITNMGNVTVASAQVTIAGTKLGSAAPLSAPPAVTNLAPGASATVTLTFPYSAVKKGATTAALKVSGTYSVTSPEINGNWVLTFRSVSL